MLLLIVSGPVFAENDAGVQEAVKVEKPATTYLQRLGLRSFGLQSGVVIADELDTGFGFGGRITRTFFSPLVELTTSGYFWGASRDSLDASTFGLEESLTLKKTHSNHLSFYSGITAGYYFTTRKYESAQNAETHTFSKVTGSFDVFITVGTTYSMKNRRVLFAQINYGITQDSGEIHILLGMNFLKGNDEESE